MKYGICAHCGIRGGCKFRQPGTWVVECEAFAELAPAEPLDITPVSSWATANGNHEQSAFDPQKADGTSFSRRRHGDGGVSPGRRTVGR